MYAASAVTYFVSIHQKRCCPETGKHTPDILAPPATTRARFFISPGRPRTLASPGTITGPFLGDNKTLSSRQAKSAAKERGE